VGVFFIFTDGEVEERKITNRIQEGTLVHSLSYWVSAFRTASYTLAIPKVELLKSVLLKTKPYG
jgi:hypothetical protein